ncbi:Adenylate cyclase 2 [Rubripirellula lacrimiformis]|uniref:Adenylate cyclase 2 n=1 Tax=Rubripirellula lacrimiformis TaxID=1930273 RepID=A0A517NKD0_9BACT|nr:adenylate/guanylate cyclase domain-containing protein [Rubripirellula lacrimiformis]QDT07592.1 Adenylate cyclase 2 [Rubripirellula lacrimiformis]
MRANNVSPAQSGSSAIKRPAVRDQLGRQLAVVLSTLDQLVLRLRSGRSTADNDVLDRVVEIRSQTEAACERVRDANDGPHARQSSKQWLESLLVAPREQSCQLLEATVKSHDAAAISLHSNMCRHLETCFDIIRTDVPHESIAHVIGQRMEAFCNRDDDTKIMSVIEDLREEPIDSDCPLVLVVAADDRFRLELEKKLGRFSERIVSCSSPQTAIGLLQQQPFDVCLIDIRIEGITASDLIHQIRQSPTSGEPSVIVVAGADETNAGAECIDNGADDCIFRPVDEKLLYSRIRASLRRANSHLSQLGKYLPRDVLAEVLKDKNLLETPSPADVSVMVCDVRGFSSTSDRIGPVQTIAWIRDVMNELSGIILDHGGTIVDYVGDEIMAMWGAPIASPQHASEACYCAMSINSALKQLSARWHPRIGTDTRIGIGINSGLAVVGNTGSTHRVKYGPHGHTVNMASRVQGATKYLRSPVLIAQSTARRIDARMRGRRICSVKVHNIHDPVDLYELAVCDALPMDASSVAYEQALVAFESKDLSRAQRLLARLLLDRPDDGPAKLLLMRVIQARLGDDFDPVWTLPGK